MPFAASRTGDSFRLARTFRGLHPRPELVQFHPSGLFEPEKAAGTLSLWAAAGLPAAFTAAARTGEMAGLLAVLAAA